MEGSFPTKKPKNCTVGSLLNNYHLNRFYTYPQKTEMHFLYRVSSHVDTFVLQTPPTYLIEKLTNNVQLRVVS